MANSRDRSAAGRAAGFRRFVNALLNDKEYTEENVLPRGPVFVSVPFDDWAAPAEGSADLLMARHVTSIGAVTDTIIQSLAARLDAARNPVLVDESAGVSR